MAIPLLPSTWRLTSLARLAAIAVAASLAITGLALHPHVPAVAITANPPSTALHVQLATGRDGRVLAPLVADAIAQILGNRSGAAATAARFAATPLFIRPPLALAVERAEASARAGLEAPDLTRWWRIELTATASPVQLEAIAALLARAPAIADVFVAPEIIPAAIGAAPEAATALDGRSCPIKTPSYQPHQGYLSAAPEGIDAPAAWSRAGGRGEAVRFADIEGAWNARHEDLPGERMRLVAGKPVAGAGWGEHGTAVVGVIAARDNDLGMVGIAPDVERVITASVGSIGPAAAIDAAAAELRPGDVLLIELQGAGPRRRYIPVEYWGDVYDAVRVATDRGIIVVAAAGNGGEDLDHRAYRGAFDPGKRDSGAILVGAGAPPRPGFRDRSRLDFSNYGRRVDVQGWGRMVATLDYGDLQSCDDRVRDRHYTGSFAGTSSASPVVAGAALLLQSIYKTATHRLLSPRQLRELLRTTGTPQTAGPFGGTEQRIGPRPDLRRALAALPL